MYEKEGLLIYKRLKFSYQLFGLSVLIITASWRLYFRFDGPHRYVALEISSGVGDEIHDVLNFDLYAVAWAIY